MSPHPAARLGSLVQQGLRLQQSSRFNEAARCYRQALEIDPASFDALQLLGVLRFRTGDFDTGIGLLERALRLCPEHGPTWNNLGNALRAAGRLREALGAYQRAVSLIGSPNALLLRNLGSALLESGELRQSADCLGAALRLAPDDAILWCWTGHLQRALEQPAEAARAYQRALSLDPALAQAYRGLGSALRELGESAQARNAYARALELEPGLLAARVMHADVGLGIAAWDRWSAESAALIDARPVPGDGVDPFPLTLITDDATVLRAYADAFAAHSTAAAPRLAARPRRTPPQAAPARLRVAYLSGDIREHPVARVIAGVLEQHDRTRFDIRLYALGAGDSSALRRRIMAACEQPIVLEAPGDLELATRIACDETDILIDLMGCTAGGRTRVLAAHPAEIQLTWLGYPCTLGGSLADYLITDEVTSPPGSEPHYAERLIRLPDSFLPHDRARVVSPPAPRATYGLPDDALVLCSFNQIRKLNPVLFGVWMELLAALPHAVLWLSSPGPTAESNLRAEAEARGVAPQRLIFGAHLPRAEDHLARYAIADLALDTFPYGSHSTAADALWAGCPLVAVAGGSFASRVSASVLSAAGVPELITGSLQDYRDLILELARDPERRGTLRARLLESRDHCALFDTTRFVRALEEAYLAVHDRHRRALEPTDIWVRPEGIRTADT